MADGEVKRSRVSIHNCWPRSGVLLKQREYYLRSPIGVVSALPFLCHKPREERDCRAGCQKMCGPSCLYKWGF